MKITEPITQMLESLSDEDRTVALNALGVAPEFVSPITRNEEIEAALPAAQRAEIDRVMAKQDERFALGYAADIVESALLHADNDDENDDR